VVAAVHEEYCGCTPAERVERVEEWLTEVRLGRRAPPVEEDEQLPPAAATRRQNEDLV
jgi:hypothetical protein